MAVFFVGAFLAGAFLAGAFLAGAFLAGVSALDFVEDVFVLGEDVLRVVLLVVAEEVDFETFLGGASILAI